MHSPNYEALNAQANKKIVASTALTPPCPHKEDLPEKTSMNFGLRGAAMFGLGSVALFVGLCLLLSVIPQRLSTLVETVGIIGSFPLTFMTIFNLYAYAVEPITTYEREPKEQRFAEEPPAIEEYAEWPPLPLGQLKKKIAELDWPALLLAFGLPAVKAWQSLIDRWDGLPTVVREDFSPWLSDIVGVIASAARAAAASDQQALPAWLKSREYQRRDFLQSEDKIQRILGLATIFPPVSEFVSAWIAANASRSASVVGLGCPIEKDLLAITSRCTDLQDLCQKEHAWRGRFAAPQPVPLLPLTDVRALLDYAPGVVSISVSSSSDSLGSRGRLPLPASPCPTRPSGPPSGSVDHRTVVVLR